MTRTHANQDLLARAFKERQKGHLEEAAALVAPVLDASTAAEIPSTYYVRGFLGAVRDPQNRPGTLHTHWKAAERVAAELDNHLDHVTATAGGTR